MPLFTPYFSLDSSAYRVGNGGRLRCHMGAAGIGIYVMLLSHLRDCRDYRAPLDYDLLAFDLHEDADAVRRVVEEFDLFDIDRASGTFTSSALDAVRALGTSDSPSSGRVSTRTGRVRRVRTAAQAYRRSVRRLAADNALPPDDDDDLADETEPAPTEEEETPPADCATAEPADARSAAEPAPAANENAPSPRTEEKRGEQKKIPHTPIVPFPPSGKGTRASHSSAPVVEEEEGASVAEVEGAVPTVADTPFTPAEEETETLPADSPTAEIESAPADASTPHGETDATQATTSADAPDTRTPHGETDTTQATTATDAPDMRTPHGEGDTTQGTTSADAPDTETTHGETDTTQGTTSVAHPDTRTPHGETNTTQATTSAAPADTHTPHGETDTTQATTSTDAPDTRTPHGETDTTQAKTSAAHPDMRTPHGETDTTQAKTSADAPDTHTPHGETDTTQGTTSADAPDTRTPHGETDTTQATLNTETAKPAPLDTKPTDDAHGADDPDGGTFVPPTANEVRRFAQALHHPEFDAEWFVHYYTARHWQRHNGHPVRSWQTTARYWLTHPLQVAQHLLRHRPAPGAAPAGTSVQLSGVSPSSAGTSPSPAGVVATTGSASPSSAGLGAVPAGTRPSSPTSGVPLGGSLSLPAPTPLQQSRLCDLRHMVLHLFADTPASAPAAVSTVPDAPAAVSTPASSASTSAPSPRVLSPAEAAHFIEAQTLSADPAEEENRACEISTADIGKGDGNCDKLASDAEEGIEKQAFPSDPAEEENRAHELSTADNEESIESQAISTDRSEKENRACELSTTDDGEDDGNCDELATDAKEGIEKQAFPSDPAEEENRAHELSTADAEEGDGNCDELASDAKESIEAQEFPTARSEEDARTCEIDNPDGGKNMDAQAISTTKERFSTRSSHGPAPPTGDEAAATAARHCPVSHANEKHPFPLSLNHDAPPILPLHPPAPVGLGSTLRVQSAQPPFGRALLGRIDLGNAPRPAGSRPLRPQPAEDRHNLAKDRRATPDHVPLGSAHEPKTADFIDKSTADEPQRRSDAGEHQSDAPEHPADEHNAPADEFDAGQRLLDTAAHRRAVRAELAACCGALRHLAHCCVAF